MIKVRKRFLLLLLLALLLAPLPADAHENEIRIRVRQNVDLEEKVEIEGNEFEIIGKVTAISDNTFTVAGQIVVIDPARVVNFEQKVNLEVGNVVKVEGPIIEGTKFAREIDSFNEEVEVKVEERGNENRVEVKARGPVEDVRSLFEDLLARLRTLFG